MLYKILEAHDGKLPDDVHVTFANTGKEMPETLDFVQACSDNWDVPIVWLELEKISRTKEQGKRAVLHRVYKITDHKNASRKGEPFDALMNGIPSNPNVVMRTCTAEMKISAITWYMVEHLGVEPPFVTAIGIRADEKRRAIKLNGTVKMGQEKWLPMWESGETLSNVDDFWDRSNFKLELPINPDGSCWYSNCDLCFLKAKNIRLSLIKNHPEMVNWWIEAENRSDGQRFRPDEPSYEQMKVIATSQGQLFDFDDESIPCFCGD